MLTENKKKIILDLLKKGIEHHGTKYYHDAVKLLIIKTMMPLGT